MINYNVSVDEKFYFGLMTLISIAIYGLIFMLVPGALIGYGLLFGGMFLFQVIMLAGRIRGNAVRITEKQFPEVHNILVNYSKALDLEKVPAMYVVQGGGMLNAFAVRLLRRDHVVIFSDIFELAYKQGLDEVSFILGHELGHIKRGHVKYTRHILLLPARLVPFLGNAYSRACEYTCDNIGHALAPQGAIKGLLVLSAGKRLYKRVDVKDYLRNFNEVEGWGTFLASIFSTHPLTADRIKALNCQTDQD